MKAGDSRSASLHVIKSTLFWVSHLLAPMEGIFNYSVHLKFLEIVMIPMNEANVRTEKQNNKIYM